MNNKQANKLACIHFTVFIIHKTNFMAHGTNMNCLLLTLIVLFHLSSSRYACADDASSNSNTCGDGEQNEQCSAQQKEEISNTSNYTTTNDQNWKWDLDSKHECSVKRISLKSLLHKFKGGLPPLHHEPLLIYNDNDDYSVPSPLNGCVHSTFSEISSESNITKSLPPDFHATLSFSNSFSAHRRTIPLKQYLNETVSTEISPHQLSNETWYLFGETYSKEWQKFLDSFCLPPCQTCTKEMSALAFGIGGRGSGVQWHTHGPGFSQSIHGRKHWVLFPPREKPLYNSDYASRHWMEETYMNMPPKQRPLECTLFPGEMIYFPDRWHHATINLDPYTAFVSTFTTEHGF